MKPARGLVGLLASVNIALGCSAASGQSGAPSSAGRASVATVERQAEQLTQRVKELQKLRDELSNLRLVGMDNGPVPGFIVQAVEGHRYDSRELVGETAFVVFFFATWCRMCELESTALRNALDVVGPVPTIPVAVDGPETWSDVADYMLLQGLDEPVVRATDHPKFAFSYNPFDTVPLVVVVGKNGGLVDYQLGYELGAEKRLIAAVRLARSIGPLVGSSRND